MNRQIPMRYNVSQKNSANFHGYLPRELYDYIYRLACEKGISMARAISEIIAEHKKSGTTS